ncbi:MAG: hypothetical protein WCV71_01945 [Patescibacteria group bacterium]
MLKNIITTGIIITMFLGALGVFVNKTQAATCTWSNGNNTAIWNDALNWTNCAGGVPGATDIVVFDGAVSNASLDLDINPGRTIAGFNMESDYTGTLDMNTNGLTITGGFTKAGGTIEMNNNGDYFEVTGDTSISGGSFVISVGYFTVTSGNFVVSGDNTFQMGGASYPVLTINGTGTKNITVSGSGNYIGRAANIGELDIIMNSVSDVITITSSVQLYNVQVYEGTLALSDGITADMDGLFIGQAGGKLQMANSTITLGRDNAAPGGNAIYHIESGFTENITGGTISIEGPGNATYGAAYFQNGSAYTPTGGTLSFIGDDSAALYSAEVDDADFNLYNISVGDGTNVKTVSINTSTVLALDLDGALTINSNATFDSNGEDILVAGSWTNNSTYVHDNNQVTFNGSGTHTIGATNATNDDFYDVVLDGGTMTLAVNFAGLTPDMEVDNDFILTSGTLDFNAGFLKVRHNFTKNGGNIVMDESTSSIEVDNDYTITADAGASNWSDGYTTVSGDVAISGDNTFVYGGSGHPVFTINGTGDFTMAITGANNFLGTSTTLAELDIDLGTSASTVIANSDLHLRDLQMYTGEFITNGNDITVPGVILLNSGSTLTMASGNIILGADNITPDVAARWHQNSGSVADISGGTITIEGPGHSGYGIMYIDDGASFAVTGGTVQFIGNDDVEIVIEESDEVDFNFYNLTIGDGTNTKSVSVSATSTINFDINNDIVINANATLNANGEAITLAGDWTNYGSFTHGNNIITFDNADLASPNNKQTLRGDTTFYNFVKDCSAFTNTQELLFWPASTTTITGSTTLRGKSGGLLTLNSSDDTNRFNINIASSGRTIDYLNVENSNQTNLDSIVEFAYDSEVTLTNTNTGWFKVSPGGGGTFYPPPDNTPDTDNTPDELDDNIDEPIDNTPDEPDVDTDIPTEPNIFSDGDLVKEKNKAAVYLIESGYKRPIFNEYTFFHFDYQWSDVVEVDNLDDYPSGEVIKVVANFQFLKNLGFRDIGQDVKRLQKFLNDNNFKLAEAGLGSPGQETEFFGQLTYQALIKFQNYYQKDILSPLNLISGTGYFGESSRSFVNLLINN